MTADRRYQRDASKPHPAGQPALGPALQFTNRSDII